MSKSGSGGCAMSSGQECWALLPSLLAALHILPFLALVIPQAIPEKAFVV